MTRYETLMLLTPDIEQESIAKVEKYVSDLSSKSKGKMLSFDVWGKYKLSFPVEKHDYGVYILARFELGENVTGALEELQSFFKIKCNEIVMRFLNRQLSKSDSLEYQKPDAIVAGEAGVSLHSDTKETSVEGKDETSEAPVKEAIKEEISSESHETKEVETDDKEQEGN